jgi:hypothetical protein|tara:strand:- start:113 stop:1531 length:1419 start_codon:yes stop_codon:yes gene_type:complete
MTSTIKVNTIQNACGTNIIKRCGTTTTVGSGASNPIVVCGSAVTIGRCGGTVALASGATQTGFGRTGTVNWQTSIKTAASFTAANGEGYFVDTSSNAVTANLPAGTAGSIVAFRDYANNFDSNKLTLAANGSQKINNSTLDLEVSTEGESITLVYADDTKGWLVVNDGNNDAGAQAQFVSATGGTESTVCTNFKVHTFTGPGTFCVSSAGNATGSNSVDYLVVAGGGGGGRGNSNGSGAGAGGYRESGGTASGCYAVSPLGSSPSSVAAVPVSVQGYSVVVGSGGAGSPLGGTGSQGGTSSALGISSAGGGGGGTHATPTANAGGPGGSGGGAGGPGGTIGNGNTPPVSPPQGNNGGSAASGGPHSGGGGATAVGSNGAPSPGSAGGAGGAGATSSINGTPTTRAGGGGGGYDSGPAGGAGGSGGGGAGSTNNAPGGAGTANTGGGGGGNGPLNGLGGTGGSGIVIIRYKFQ